MQYNFNQQTLLLNTLPLSLIKFEGIEARQFLNSQFTNDLNKLDGTHWQLNGYCNPKGRLLSIMRVYQLGEAFYVTVSSDIAENIYKQLQIYIFRSKVKLSIIKQISIQSIIGPSTKSTIASQFGIELSKGGHFNVNNCQILDLSSAFDQCLVIANSSLLFKELDSLSNVGSQQCWRLSQIRQGSATIYSNSQGKFIPQQLNLESQNAISFTKGCYPGQEVIARLHYLGKSKQSMQPVQVESELPIQAGNQLSINNIRATLVDSVQTVNNQYECLAVGPWPIAQTPE